MQGPCSFFSSSTNVFSVSFQLIQKGTKLVLEQVVTSIASVADTAEEKFVPYYDLFMPSLKHIVENAVQKELRLLRGKTIECISLIGLAVGKEKVSPGDFEWVKRHGDTWAFSSTLSPHGPTLSLGFVPDTCVHLFFFLVGC